MSIIKANNSWFSLPDATLFYHYHKTHADLFLFICLFLKVIFTQKRKEIFHQLVHFPNCGTGQNRVDPKPGTRSIFLVSYVHPGTKGLELASTTLLDHKQLDWKWGSRKINEHP